MMKSWRWRKSWGAVLGSFIAMCLAVHVEAREITDMFGKHYRLPDRARNVYSASPPNTWLLYAIDPTILAGLNFPVRDVDKRFLHGHVRGLPLIGGTFGQSNIPNFEILLRVNPELVVVSGDETPLSRKINGKMRILKKPVVEMTLIGLADYPDAFLRMGRILGREARARKLSDYCRQSLAEASAITGSIPVKDRLSVYYAEGADGLSTECDDSRHTELIKLAGGRNVHRCKARDLYGMEKVSMEQILVYNPQVILVMDELFYRRIRGDPRWRRIRAVRDGKVYLIPRVPINWFDRPPSFMRFIGLKWLMNSLYPERCPADIVKEAREFYRLFLGVEVSDREIREVMGK